MDSSSLVVGDLMPVYKNHIIPKGWLNLDGKRRSKKKYPALYALLTTHHRLRITCNYFYMPDLRLLDWMLIKY